jgi:hypothetical protein
MSDFLYILWTIVSFIIGVLWSIVWFILRDLLSTLLWVGIAIWLAFVLRYRSFGLGSLALLRWVRYAAAWGWRWLRGPARAPARDEDRQGIPPAHPAGIYLRIRTDERAHHRPADHHGECLRQSRL